ncbi:MAG: alpha/beta fold hydrolase [Dehalococcoidia bacterium]
MNAPTETRLAINGVEIQVYEWPGFEPAAFLAHATGFHARCWDQVVSQLGGRRCIAIDMRGHGLSSKPPPPYRWVDFGEDTAEVLRVLGVRGAIGVGHSKGGFAVTWAAAKVPEAFRALLLVDPVILPKGAYGREQNGEEHFAARRRNEWSSPEEMFERFASRPPFNRWKPEVLRDYCRYGLVPAAAGDGFVLACPPEVEAATYAGSAGSGAIYDAVATIDIPVRILRARPQAEDPSAGMSGSPTNPELATYFRNAIDLPVYHYTHFIPMEDPAFVAQEIERLAAV